MTRTEEEKCRCLRAVPGLKKRLYGREEAADKARLLRLMAHPTRLQILRLLCESDVCVCVLSKSLGRSQANVSQHLAKLKDGGVIECYPSGKLVYYRIRDTRIARIIRF